MIIFLRHNCSVGHNGCPTALCLACTQVKIKSSRNITSDPVAELKKAMEELREKLQKEIDQLRSQHEGAVTPGSVQEQEALAALKDALQEQAVCRGPGLVCRFDPENCLGCPPRGAHSIVLNTGLHRPYIVLPKGGGPFESRHPIPPTLPTYPTVRRCLIPSPPLHAPRQPPQAPPHQRPPRKFFTTVGCLYLNRPPLAPSWLFVAHPLVCGIGGIHCLQTP